MVLKFNEYANSNMDLSYLALDWDDNILHMSTMIHLDHLVDGEWIHTPVSTSKFAEVRADNINWRRRDDSFCEFRDNGPRGETAFLQDVKSAISNKEFGPSWDSFIKYLSQGAIFAIITARGHSPKVLRMGVEWIIDNILDEDQKFNLYSHCLKFAYIFDEDYDSYDRIPKGQLSKTKLISDYLDNCDFYGVSSDYCIQKFGLGDASNPEKGKEMAIKEFTEKAHKFGEKIGATVSLGFSDDDIKNVEHIEKLFAKELSLTYALKFSIFDTSKRHIKGGVKKVISPELSESQSSFGSINPQGIDSSVLPFTKWNNMTQHLYPNTKGDSTDDYHNSFKNQLGQLGDLSKNIDKKKA